MQLPQARRSSSCSQHSRSSASSFDALLDEIGTSLRASTAGCSNDRTKGLPPVLQLQQGLQQANQQYKSLSEASDYEEPSPAAWLCQQQRVSRLASAAEGPGADALPALHTGTKQQPRLTAIAEESSSCFSSPTASSAPQTVYSVPVPGILAPASGMQSGTSGLPPSIGTNPVSAADIGPAPAVQLRSGSGSRSMRPAGSGSGIMMWDAAAAAALPSTPAATAVTESLCDRATFCTVTPTTSSHSSAIQLAQSGPASPCMMGIGAFLQDVNPVDSWVATHSTDAPPPNQSWSSRAQSAANIGWASQATSNQSSANGATYPAANAPDTASMLPEAAAGTLHFSQQQHSGQFFAVGEQYWLPSSNPAPVVLPLPATATSQSQCWDGPAATAAQTAGSSRDSSEEANGTVHAEYTAACRCCSSQISSDRSTRRSSCLDHELSVGWHGCSASSRQSDSLQQDCTSSSFHLHQEMSSEFEACGQVPETPAAFSGQSQQQHIVAPWADARNVVSSGQTVYQMQQPQQMSMQGSREQQQQQQDIWLVDAGRQQHVQLQQPQSSGQQQNRQQLLDNNSSQQRLQHAQAAVFSVSNSAGSSNQALLSALNPLEFVLWQQRQHQRTLLERALHALTTLQSDVANLLQAHQSNAVAAAQQHVEQQQQQDDCNVALECTMQPTTSGCVLSTDSYSPEQHLQQQQQQQEQDVVQVKAAGADQQAVGDHPSDSWTIPAVRGSQSQKSTADGATAQPQLQQLQKVSTMTGDDEPGGGNSMCKVLANSHEEAAVRANRASKTCIIAGSDAVDMDSFEAELLQSEAAAPGRRLSDETLRHYHTAHAWSEDGKLEQQQQQEQSTVRQDSADGSASIAESVVTAESSLQDNAQAASRAEGVNDLQQQQQKQKQGPEQQQEQGQGKGVLENFERQLLALQAAQLGRQLYNEAAGLHEGELAATVTPAVDTQAADTAEAAPIATQQVAAPTEAPGLDSLEAESLAGKAAETDKRVSEESTVSAAATECCTLSASIIASTGTAAASNAKHVTFLLPGELDSTVSGSAGTDSHGCSFSQQSAGKNDMSISRNTDMLNSTGGCSSSSGSSSSSRIGESAAGSNTDGDVTYQAGILTVALADQAAGLTGGDQAGLTGAEESSFEAKLLRLESEAAAAAAGLVMPSGKSSNSICSSNEGSGVDEAPIAAQPPTHSTTAQAKIGPCASILASADDRTGAANQPGTAAETEADAVCGSGDDFEAMMRANEQAARQAAGNLGEAVAEDRWWEDAPEEESKEDLPTFSQPQAPPQQQQQQCTKEAAEDFCQIAHDAVLQTQPQQHQQQQLTVTAVAEARQAVADAAQLPQQQLGPPQQQQPVAQAIALLLEKHQQLLQQQQHIHAVIANSSEAIGPTAATSSSSSSKDSSEHDSDMVLEFGRVGSIGGAAGLPLSPRTAAKTGILEFEWMAAQAGAQQVPHLQQQQQQTDDETAQVANAPLVATAAVSQMQSIEQQPQQQLQLSDAFADSTSQVDGSAGQIRASTATALQLAEQQQQQQIELFTRDVLPFDAQMLLNKFLTSESSNAAAMAVPTGKGSSSSSSSKGDTGATASEGLAMDNSSRMITSIGVTSSSADAAEGLFTEQSSQHQAPVYQINKQPQQHKQQQMQSLSPTPGARTQGHTEGHTSDTADAVSGGTASAHQPSDKMSGKNTAATAPSSLQQCIVTSMSTSGEQTSASKCKDKMSPSNAEQSPCQLSPPGLACSRNVSPLSNATTVPVNDVIAAVPRNSDSHCSTTAGDASLAAEQSGSRKFVQLQQLQEEQLLLLPQGQQQVQSSSSSSSSSGGGGGGGGGRTAGFKQLPTFTVQQLGEHSSSGECAVADDNQRHHHAEPVPALGAAMTTSQGQSRIESSHKEQQGHYQQQQPACSNATVQVQGSLEESSSISTLPDSLSVANSSFLSLPCSVSGDTTPSTTATGSMSETSILLDTKQQGRCTPAFVGKMHSAKAAQAAAAAATHENDCGNSYAVTGCACCEHSVVTTATYKAKRSSRHHSQQQHLLQMHPQQEQGGCNSCCGGSCCQRSTTSADFSRKAAASGAAVVHQTGLHLTAVGPPFFSCQHAHGHSSHLWNQSCHSSTSSGASSESRTLSCSSSEEGFAFSTAVGTDAASAVQYTCACQHMRCRAAACASAIHKPECLLAKKLAGIDSKLQQIEHTVKQHRIEEEKLEADLLQRQQQLQQQRQRERNQQQLWDAEAANIGYGRTSITGAEAYELISDAQPAERNGVFSGVHSRTQRAPYPAAAIFIHTACGDACNLNDADTAWNRMQRQQGRTAKLNAYPSSAATTRPCQLSVVEDVHGTWHATTLEGQLDTGCGVPRRPWLAAAGSCRLSDYNQVITSEERWARGHSSNSLHSTSADGQLQHSIGSTDSRACHSGFAGRRQESFGQQLYGMPVGEWVLPPQVACQLPASAYDTLQQPQTPDLLDIPAVTGAAAGSLGLRFNNCSDKSVSAGKLSNTRLQRGIDLASSSATASTRMNEHCNVAVDRMYSSSGGFRSSSSRPVSAPAAGASRHLHSAAAVSSLNLAGTGTTSNVVASNSLRGHGVGGSSLWSEVIHECQKEMMDQALLMSETAGVYAETRVVVAALRTSWGSTLIV